MFDATRHISRANVSSMAAALSAYRGANGRIASMPTSMSILAQSQPLGEPYPRIFFFQEFAFRQLGLERTPLTEILFDVTVIAALVLPLVMLVAMISIWAERRVAGRIQSRLGPNRVGPMGLFQSLADGIKLLFKEDLIPKDADSILFRL